MTPSKKSSAPLELSAIHLVHRAAQTADEIFASHIGRSDLTPRQYEVLRAVSRIDEPSQTTLVTATGIDRSTLADIVRRLTERGMLHRRRTRQDARMYAVTLTEAGAKALKSAEPVVQATNQQLLANLNKTEREQLMKILRKVVASVDDRKNGRDGD